MAWIVVGVALLALSSAEPSVPVWRIAGIVPPSEPTKTATDDFCRTATPAACTAFTADAAHCERDGRDAETALARVRASPDEPPEALLRTDLKAIPPDLVYAATEASPKVTPDQFGRTVLSHCLGFMSQR